MEEKKKPRKRTSGLIRDKERTMQKMIDAVKIVLLKDGYAGLSATAVAKEAGVDKRLVWTYFGSLDNLVDKYISQRDKLKLSNQITTKKLLDTHEKTNQENLKDLISDRLKSLLEDPELQRITQWQINENKEFLDKISHEREKVTKQVLENLEINVDANKDELKAKVALIIGGMQYLTLYSATNNSSFCGLNIFNANDLDLIKETIDNMIRTSFKNN